MFKKIRKWLALLVEEEVRSQRLEILILRQQLTTFKFKEKRRPRISKFDKNILYEGEISSKEALGGLYQTFARDGSDKLNKLEIAQ